MGIFLNYDRHRDDRRIFSDLFIYKGNHSI